MFPGRLDDKGRLKLPVAFQEYLNALPEKKLYVTSLDRRIARIYPMSIWRENENFFDTFRDNPRAAQDAAFNAADLGGEAEMDSQGRLLFPSELRRELGIENQPVHLYSYKGKIEVLSEQIYQARKQRASQAPEQTVELLEQAGLK